MHQGLDDNLKEHTKSVLQWCIPPADRLDRHWDSDFDLAKCVQVVKEGRGPRKANEANVPAAAWRKPMPNAKDDPSLDAIALPPQAVHPGSNPIDARTAVHECDQADKIPTGARRPSRRR